MCTPTHACIHTFLLHGEERVSGTRAHPPTHAYTHRQPAENNTADIQVVGSLDMISTHTHTQTHTHAPSQIHIQTHANTLPADNGTSDIAVVQSVDVSSAHTHAHRNTNTQIHTARR